MVPFGAVHSRRIFESSAACFRQHGVAPADPTVLILGWSYLDGADLDLDWAGVAAGLTSHGKPGVACHAIPMEGQSGVAGLSRCCMYVKAMPTPSISNFSPLWCVPKVTCSGFPTSPLLSAGHCWAVFGCTCLRTVQNRHDPSRDKPEGQCLGTRASPRNMQSDVTRTSGLLPVPGRSVAFQLALVASKRCSARLGPAAGGPRALAMVVRC